MAALCNTLASSRALSFETCAACIFSIAAVSSSTLAANSFFSFTIFFNSEVFSIISTFNAAILSFNDPFSCTNACSKSVALESVTVGLDADTLEAAVWATRFNSPTCLSISFFSRNKVSTCAVVIQLLFERVSLHVFSLSSAVFNWILILFTSVAFLATASFNLFLAFSKTIFALISRVFNSSFCSCASLNSP